ncbi:hypothetical protein BGX28_003311 [Mortierella sp. GBA30]|nr:hypothetical protein BGX28_003311 [Mortierella sp. GBA30]
MNLSRTFPLLFPNLQRHDPTPQPSPANTPRLVGDNRITSKPPGTTTITMLTRNEIERTIMQHRPHFIRTMSLPVQRLPAFQSIGPRLASLVRFELYGISWHFNLDPAIAFLREHAACYGTIRELKMAGPNDVRLLQKPKLHDVIKTIKHPKLIDLSRYKEATRDLNSFEIQNMDGLEHLFFDLDFVPVPAAPQVITTTAAEAPGTSSSTSTLTITFPILDQAMDSAKNDALDLIRQCTRLTTLHIGVRSSTMFAWAVDCYNFDPASLQQLKVLHLSSNRTIIVKQVLDDCLYAFRDTLEDLKGIALKLSPNPSPMSFGWTWPLQQLSVLSLKGELAAWFDFESLRYCPKLTEICLTLNPYSPPKTDHLEKLVLASQLATLSLLGRWIVSDTLMAHVGEGLQRLKKLTLEGCQDDALTGEGLIEGLEKMKALRRLDIGLGASVEVAVREYRETRPGLDITMRSDDLPRL